VRKKKTVRERKPVNLNAGPGGKETGTRERAEVSTAGFKVKKKMQLQEGSHVRVGP